MFREFLYAGVVFILICAAFSDNGLRLQINDKAYCISFGDGCKKGNK